VQTWRGDLATTHAPRSVPRGFDSSGLHVYPDPYGFCGSGSAPLSNLACGFDAGIRILCSVRRAREMALRISIGAGRSRLVQLVLIESAWIALFAAAVGGLFAWWAAPFVVSRINPPDNPARVSLPADWRVFGFALALTLAVTFLFGLIPALRASAIKTASALKGGDDPHSRRVAGLGLGMASVRYIETLFHQVKATDLVMLAFPSLILLVVALLAALPAVIRAVRTDPVAMLRAE
jgi:ABC-type lipoprotein release transport system permease subunit